MPIDQAFAGMHPVAARRILRLALGTTLSLALSQSMGWSLAYLAPVITLFLLALPLPAPGIKKSIAIVLALLLPMVASLALLPVLDWARWAGILLLALALFYCFYFTAKGGSPALGTIMTIGLTLVVTIGSVNQDLLVMLISALAINASMGVAFVWLAHLLLPDLPLDVTAPKPPKAAAVDPAVATGNAMRSLLIVLPIALLFLFSSGSAAFTPVMIKVASLGQQASADRSRSMGLSLVVSTLWGGLGAFIIWTLLGAWPSLLVYMIAVAVAALLFGRRIFNGVAVFPDFDKWSYALVTMLILLGPAVVDSPLSDGIGFMQRLGLFLLIAVYGTVAVAVFDAFRDPGRAGLPAPPS